jgi:hypothetical protein
MGFAFIPPISLPTADPVGAGLPAMAPFQSHQWRLCRHHRWQVESSNRSSHRFCIHPANLTAHRRPCGSWLASDGVLSVTSMAPVPTSSLASRIVEPQLPQVLHSSRHPHYQPQPLWELACQRWRPSSHINGACADLIAGKPAPTRICIHRHVVVAPASTAPAVPVPVRWLRAAVPIIRRCCRRLRSRGTGSRRGSRCCRRRSGS